MTPDGKIIVGPWWVYLQELGPAPTYAETGLFMPLGYLRESQAVIKTKIVEVLADNAPSAVKRFGMGLEECSFKALLLQQDVQTLCAMIGQAQASISGGTLLDVTGFGALPAFHLMAFRPDFDGFSWNPTVGTNNIANATCDMLDIRVCTLGSEAITLGGAIDDASNYQMVANAMSASLVYDIPAKFQMSVAGCNLQQVATWPHITLY